MAGLPTKSDNALQQWHHLFESRGESRSLQAQQHWQQLMRVGLPTRKHENWKYTALDGLRWRCRWTRSVWCSSTVSFSRR